jgi:hypothetical protein
MLLFSTALTTMNLNLRCKPGTKALTPISMKPVLLLALLIAGSFTAQSQKLKDLLYSGKLKNDSNTVIRKTDDLSTKIDTGTRKPAEPAQTVIAVIDGNDSSMKKVQTPAVTSTKATSAETKEAATASTTNTTTESNPPATETTAVVEAAPPAAPVKSTGKLWKEFTDGIVGELKSELNANRKIKKEMYYVTVDYEIETTGQTSVTNVTTSPENAHLQALLKDRMMTGSPQLQPVAKKVKRKYNFTYTKE